VRLISRLCDIYLVMAMRPLFTASGMSRKRWDRAAIDRGLAEVTNALGYIEHYLGDSGYAVGDTLTWADGALTPQLMLSYEWAPALFGSENPLGKHPKLAAYWAAIAKDPIAARVLKETREAVAHEQANARAIAKSRA
jgi:glutathione S-transferase